MCEPHTGISWWTNLSQTDWIPATDRTSKWISFFKAGRIAIASTFWQSSTYNSVKTVSNLAATFMIPNEVRREHCDKFTDLKEGAEWMIAFKPSSERR